MMKYYEKPLGEKVLESIILTIAITGTAWLMYGVYEIVDIVFIRSPLC